MLEAQFALALPIPTSTPVVHPGDPNINRASIPSAESVTMHSRTTDRSADHQAVELPA